MQHVGDAQRRARPIVIDLPCVRCGYDLRGLDVAGACPECGFAVRETITFVVDPLASEVEPLQHRRRIGVAVVAASGLVLVAVLLLWSPHVVSVVDDLGGWGGSLVSGFPRWTAALSGAMGLGAWAAMGWLKRPTGEVEPERYRRDLRIGRAALLAWAGLMAGLGAYDVVYRDAWAEALTPLGTVPDLGRAAIRVGLDGAGVLMALRFKTVLRFLLVRSLNPRLSRTSRQGFGALLVAVGIVTAADVIRLTAAGATAVGTSEAVFGGALFVASILLLVGAAMLTLALLNAFSDSVKLARGISGTPLRLSDILGEP